jgi:uncharacterized protein (DUF2147 family)
MIPMTISVSLLALMAGGLAAPDEGGILGRWLSESGDGAIEIYRCGDKVCGKLAWLAHPIVHGAPAHDIHNTDEKLRQRPLCGLSMLGDFRQVDGTRWDDGWIYNPEDGNTYRATMTLENPAVLKLRGYVLISLFGKTETWTRADPSMASCDGR